jgi:beta-xylosidase
VRRVALLILLACWGFPAWCQENVFVVVDSAAKSTPLTHFWESGFGSGRAILSLRESYRNDLREVKKVTGIQYVRFHAILVTKRKDGKLVVALWNLWPPDKPGTARTMDLEFRGVAKNSRVAISRVDDTHGNTVAVYKKMGTSRYPTETQVQELNRESALQPAEKASLKNGHLRLTLPVNGFALLEFDQ